MRVEIVFQKPGTMQLAPPVPRELLLSLVGTRCQWSQLTEQAPCVWRQQSCSKRLSGHSSSMLTAPPFPLRQKPGNLWCSSLEMACGTLHSRTAVPKAGSPSVQPICLTRALLSPPMPKGLVTPIREPPGCPEHPKVLLHWLSLPTEISYPWVLPEEPQEEA